MADRDSLLASVFGRLPVGICVVSLPDGRVVLANEALLEVLGTRSIEFSSLQAAAAALGLHDGGAKPYRLESAAAQLRKSSESLMLDDVVVHRADGRRVPLRLFAVRIGTASDGTEHVAIAVLDITRESTAEQQRAATQTQLALAVNQSPIAIWTIDHDGVITLSEGAGLAALGVRSGELVGQNVFELYADHPTIASYIRRALAGEIVPYTVEVNHAIYDTLLMPVHAPSGHVSGAIGLSHDVSEIRHLQAIVIQNDRMIAMGTLAASVAHEINNPLTYMLGHADRILDRIVRLEKLAADAERCSAAALLELAADLRDHLRPLQVGASRIATITRELRAFNQQDGAEMRAVDAGRVIRSVLQLVGKDLEARANLVLALEPVPLILGSEARLTQVVLNLILNAMQALPKHTQLPQEVSIRSGFEAGNVVIEIADSGPGVAAADRTRIFEPFVTSKEIGEGTGLGLFVCRNIVRSMGGDIAVDDRPGGGARFTVRLPASDSGRIDRPADSVVSAPSAVGKILVVDDDELVGQVLVMQLRAAGNQAERVDGATRALDTLATQRDAFDLIYCDLMMRNMTGMEFAERLSHTDPALLERVVFMTGGAFTPQAREFCHRHAAGCIQKPFDIVRETATRLMRPLV